MRPERQTFAPPLVWPPSHPRLAALPQAAQQSVSTLDVEDLSNDYCDDFVCNSSPAVENTIRAFAKDLQRCNGTWTRSLLARTVEYKVCLGWQPCMSAEYHLLAGAHSNSGKCL